MCRATPPRFAASVAAVGMKVASVAVIALAVVSFTPVVTAQPAPPGAQRVPTVTRLVKLFSELEITLNDRIAAKDAAAIAQTLDPGFEARNAENPGTPLPRAEWIAAGIADPGTNVRVEQMAVHDFGTVAVVSFRLVDAPSLAPASRRERFIVDCWTRAGERWLLTVRYVGTSGLVAAPPVKRAPHPTGKN